MRLRRVCICGAPEDLHEFVPKAKCPGYQERYSMNVHSLHPVHDECLAMETIAWDSKRKWFHRLWDRFRGRMYCFWCQSGQPVDIVTRNPFNKKGPGLYVTVTCKTCGNVVGPMASSFLLDVLRHMSEIKGEYRAALVAKRFMLMTGVQLRD